MPSRRSFLSVAGGVAVTLAGCSGRSEDVIHVEPVETVTLGDAPIAGLPPLPEPLGVAIANVLRRNAGSGSWRLDGDPTENEALAAALDERPFVATRGQRYHLNGIYAVFEYDQAADEIVATAAFPAGVAERDSPPPHAFEREALPEDVRTPVETAMGQESAATLGDAQEYTEGTYDGAYVRHESKWYRTAVETLA